MILPLFVRTSAAPTAPPVQRVPLTVMQAFFRKMHLEVINAIQAGRGDEAYAYARLLVFVGTVMQPRPIPQPVGPAWKEWQRAWRKLSQSSR